MTDAASLGPAAVPAGRYLLRPPEPGNSAVTAWADDYIHIKPRPEWQSILCSEITTRCGRLEPSADEVLHATFFGNKPPRMDIENLLLYNLDYSFKSPGRNGIRFEHGRDLPATADGEAYEVGYRYALAPRSAGFTDWDQGPTVASFGWTGLGVFRREKVPAQVWLALARRRAGEAQRLLRAGTSFAVKVELRPPQTDSSGLNAELVKGIIDGVVSAFQAHTDMSTSTEVAARLATVLPADSSEIEALLLDRRWAVLGAVPRLLHLRGAAVQWNPSDDYCDAGELISVEPTPAAPEWAIRGQIVELRDTHVAAPNYSPITFVVAAAASCSKTFVRGTRFTSGTHISRPAPQSPRLDPYGTAPGASYLVSKVGDEVETVILCALEGLKA